MLHRRKARYDDAGGRRDRVDMSRQFRLPSIAVRLPMHPQIAGLATHDENPRPTFGIDGDAIRATF